MTTLGRLLFDRCPANGRNRRILDAHDLAAELPLMPQSGRSFAPGIKVGTGWRADFRCTCARGKGAVRLRPSRSTSKLFRHRGGYRGKGPPKKTILRCRAESTDHFQSGTQQFAMFRITELVRVWNQGSVRRPSSASNGFRFIQKAQVRMARRKRAIWSYPVRKLVHDRTKHWYCMVKISVEKMSNADSRDAAACSVISRV